jgi:3-dehydroquinate synthase
MNRISVPLSGGRGYDIAVGASLPRLGLELKRLGLGPRVLVVSAPPVARRYAAPLLAGLARAGLAATLAGMPDGEDKKNLDTVRRLYASALKARLDRRSTIVALGGGVVGDVAGFLAATYLRGLAFVQCPTTLLAMVDASIGGKTGVDLPEGKNLVGAFHQPRLVWMDLSTLSTLPDRQWRTGMAEVIKYGFIGDPSLLARLEREDLDSLQGKPALLADIVARSAGMKARVVAADERETRGRRELLNLGHTFGNAIETVSGYRDYTHGEAVAIGLCAAARLRGWPADVVARVDALVARWGLPVRARRPLPRGKILAAMARDKKNLAGRWRFVVPRSWGSSGIMDVTDRERLNVVLSEVGL